MATFAVMGATGNIGGELTRLLLKKGKKVRAVARNAAKLDGLARQGAEVGQYIGIARLAAPRGRRGGLGG